MEFAIEKYAKLIMKIGKRESAEDKEQTNQEFIMRIGEQENYKYLVILKAVTLKAKMKQKVRK